MHDDTGAAQAQPLTVDRDVDGRYSYGGVYRVITDDISDGIITVEEAAKLIISAGLVTPEDRKPADTSATLAHLAELATRDGRR